MAEFENPYVAPASDVRPPLAPPTRVDRFPLLAWPLLFAMNMALPLLFGLDETRRHGRIGMCVALLLMLMAGWVFCLLKGSAARKLILGSSVIALTQVFPILQILAGSIAIGIGQSLHILEQGGDDAAFGLSGIHDEFGGFAVTMLVGLILLSCASMAGLVLGQILPARWFKPRENESPDVSS